MAKTLDRTKVNFMISKEIMIQFRQLIPAGERSDFLNEALAEALIKFSRQKASEEIDKLAEKANFKFSTKDFLKIRHEGLL